MIDLPIALRRLKAFVTNERLKNRNKVKNKRYKTAEIISQFITIDENHNFVSYDEIKTMINEMDNYEYGDKEFDKKEIKNKMKRFIKYADNKNYDMSIMINFFIEGPDELKYDELLQIIQKMENSDECNMKEKMRDKRTTLTRTMKKFEKINYLE